MIKTAFCGLALFGPAAVSGNPLTKKGQWRTKISWFQCADPEHRTCVKILQTTYKSYFPVEIGTPLDGLYVSPNADYMPGTEFLLAEKIAVGKLLFEKYETKGGLAWSSVTHEPRVVPGLLLSSIGMTVKENKAVLDGIRKFGVDPQYPHLFINATTKPPLTSNVDKSQLKNRGWLRRYIGLTPEGRELGSSREGEEQTYLTITPGGTLQRETSL